MYVDFSDVKDNRQGTITPGTYAATVTRVEERVSQAGKPYISWDFILTGGEYDGAHVWLNTSLSSKALWRLKKILTDAFEIDASRLHGQFEFDSEEFVGRDVAVVIKKGEYNGQERSEVDTVLNAASAVASAPF